MPVRRKNLDFAFLLVDDGLVAEDDGVGREERIALAGAVLLGRDRNVTGLLENVEDVDRGDEAVTRGDGWRGFGREGGRSVCAEVLTSKHIWFLAARRPRPVGLSYGWRSGSCRL